MTEVPCELRAERFRESSISRARTRREQKSDSPKRVASCLGALGRNVFRACLNDNDYPKCKLSRGQRRNSNVPRHQAAFGFKLDSTAKELDGTRP